jgi:hypothetical protein
MPAIRREHASQKSSLWQFLLCGHETEYVENDSSGYKSSPPARCPKCGRSADEPEVDSSIPASAVFSEGDGPTK